MPALSQTDAKMIEDRVVAVAREEIAQEAKKSRALQARINSMQSVIHELRAIIEAKAEAEDEINAALQEAIRGRQAAEQAAADTMTSSTQALQKMEARIQSESEARAKAQAGLLAAMRDFDRRLAEAVGKITAPKPAADYELKITERGPNNNIKTVSVSRK